MDFLKQLAADAVMASPHAVDVTHNDGTTDHTKRAVIRRGVQVWEGQNVVSRDFISLQKSQAPQPETGHTITDAAGDTWTLTDREKDDGQIIKFKARPHQ